MKFIISLITSTLLMANFYIDTTQAKSKDIHKKSDNIQKYNLSDIPTSLLNSLQESLEREQIKDPSISSIVGIHESQLRNELNKRHENPEESIADRQQFNPKKQPSELLKYIAEHDETHGGCSPDEALVEFNQRAYSVPTDIAGVVANEIRQDDIHLKRKQSAEEFSDRENKQDMEKAVQEIQEIVKSGTNPSTVAETKQVEEEKNKNKSEQLNEAILDASDGVFDGKPPHGYNDEIQQERTKEEIQDNKKQVQDRSIIPEEQEDLFGNLNNFFTNDDIQTNDEQQFSGDVEDAPKSESLESNILSLVANDTELLT